MGVKLADHLANTSPCARLTRAAKQNMRMFRGHLSRSACRHVKHRAKRSGISQNRRLVSSPSGAVGAEDLNDDEPAQIPRSQDAEARDAIDPWRIDAFEIR